MRTVTFGICADEIEFFHRGNNAPAAESWKMALR